MHTYADIDSFKAYLTDNGVSAMGTATDGPLLAVLEAASRRVEGYCGRSPAGQSGFGPRTGTNSYDAQGWYGGYTLYRDNMVLDLDDDLLTATTVTVLDQTGGSPTTLTLDTDFYLQPYNKTPKRQLIITGLGQSYIVPGLKILSILGTWGYAQELAAGTATLGTVSSSATTAVISGSGVSVGMTMRVDSEDLYITGTTAGTLSSSGGTVTVTRGANGTTAALHAASAPISVHRYPREVAMATLLVAQRRWKGRDAGSGGNFGGVGMPGTGFQDTERGLLSASVGHLKVTGIG